MEKIDTLRDYGLFDALVPRYRSYPPANHFVDRVGQQNQENWLGMVPSGSDVSVYIHIPFCKRLCWFCACRTQGTRTLRPVDAYVEFLIKELWGVKKQLAPDVKVARLHLGGGTPTILSPGTMTLLLNEVFKAFPRSAQFEFSVEIDPTEASRDLLSTLIDHGLNRASLGVQDFAPRVQDAIGRPQSLEQTRDVIAFLRDKGITALNLDVLYGLPHQTVESFGQTLDHVIGLKPNRLAIYGYAHVPWMSKRQVMIKEADLPGSETRFALASMARARLQDTGFETIGIDHFATPRDGLSKVQASGQVRRNFQGYTDDQSQTLIGIGASAISKFPQGYLQNAVATSAYQNRITQTGLAAHKGYAMNGTDKLVGCIVEDLLCRFELNTAKLALDFPQGQSAVREICVLLVRQFPDVFFINQAGLKMHDWAQPLVRIIANVVDEFTATELSHSTAI
ncbi:oxygen-independent coproporphyrinogen III oxidase [Sulfitobacter sp. SK012]|uniref:oxygen-independent coproporphyrinogen III oxidase n=1 Tax=Sulfitobacter sp. SK012 TaxID=1389005 RepID=UPI000E0C3F77|nr:oxygen-independent coproporphyrinogen III oxidase [Sulfitobacter sp. SK012]AXI45228.1 oxygen-independent coproporphyrinogen III oxidase [Sulfitobacter sp. SK012]